MSFVSQETEKARKKRNKKGFRFPSRSFAISYSDATGYDLTSGTNLVPVSNFGSAFLHKPLHHFQAAPRASPLQGSGALREQRAAAYDSRHKHPDKRLVKSVWSILPMFYGMVEKRLRVEK